MALTPLQSPLFALFVDDAVSGVFDDARAIARYGRVEAALAAAMASEGLISSDAAVAIAAATRDFAPDPVELATGSLRDGLPIPAYVRALRATVAERHRAALHQGSTSQDIIDTALALALTEVNALLSARLDALLIAIDALDARFAAAPLIGRTRMQAALPVTVGHRLAGWRAPLARERRRFDDVRAQVEVVQFGGPVGTRDGFAGRADTVARHIANELGLRDPGAAWHTARDGLGLYAGWLARVSAALGKVGSDVVLMAQQGIGEVALRGGGGSSAMPHKQNPVAAELLVTLAGLNATLSGGFHHAMVHEQERSGIAWPLEWLILPQMCAATGVGLLRAGDLLGAVLRLGPPEA